MSNFEGVGSARDSPISESANQESIMSTAEATANDSVQTCRVPAPEEKLVRVLAGVVSLTGLGLGYFVSDWWFLLTGFAGLNVIQSAFTGFCPPEIVYRWMNR